MAGRFFCDHCGAQVPLEVAECPACHRSFGDVLCPRCQHSGPSKTFANGCPSCGFMARTARQAATAARVSWFGPVMAVLVVLLLLAGGIAWMVQR
jgi:hypothetical protein